LALFRHPGKAARVAPQLPPGQLLSCSKMPLSVSMLTVLHGEILYFQPPANQKRKLPCDLTSSGNTHKLLKVRGCSIGAFSLSGVAGPVMTISFRHTLPPAPYSLSSITRQTSASPFGVAPDASVAPSRPPSGAPSRQPYRIEIQALAQTHPIHRAPYHPCDASCQKRPPDASQNFEPPP
jgi:hypothetical protein